MFFYDPSLTLLALLPVPFAMLLVHITRGLIQCRTTAAREAHAALTTTLQEQLAGLRVLRLFGRTGESLQRVEEQSLRVQKANFASVMLREGLQPVYSTLMVAGVALVIAIGGQRVIAGALSVGAFVAFMDLFLRFTSRAYRIPRLFNTIQAGGVAYARLEPLLAASHQTGVQSHSAARPTQTPRPSNAQPASSLEKSSPYGRGPIGLSIKNISFRYPDAAQPILKGVSLDIPAGSFVALTGPVGSGKSALLRVILGLYAAEQGEVWLDGRRLEDFSAAERTARIGYLHQDPYLFSGDIGENIAFGPTEKVSPVRFEQAVRTALLETDLQAFPAGLSTPVGELGSRVSGGQRQRIAMARTLAATSASPGLLLLDDPFSAVDLATEARLIASLRQTFGPEAPPNQRATILLSSHRLAAFPQADQVILLNQGRIKESGTHESLMASGGAYARIFQAQVRVTRPDLPDHLAFPGEARPEHNR